MAETLHRIRTDTQLTDKSTVSNGSAGSNSSSSSAIAYNLDEDDRSPILVYQWQGGISTMSQQRLCQELDSSLKRKRVTKKPIERFTSTIEVKRHDLFLPEEQEWYKDKPNYDSSLASIRVPRMAFWSRALYGSYDELYIISPESSANSSIAGPSRKATMTFEPEVIAGAEQD